MRRLLPLLLLGVSAAPAHAQPNEAPRNFVDPPVLPRKPPRPRPAEPAAQIAQDMQDFVAAFNARADFFRVQRWVYGARFGYFGANAWWDQLSKTLPITIQVDNLAVGAIEGESATVTLSYHLQAGPGVGAEAKAELEKPLTETLALHLGPDSASPAEKLWQLVPPATEEAAQKGAEARVFLAYVAYYLAQKGPLNLRLPSTKAALSTSHLKQLGLGVLMFVQDWDERYAFAPEYLHDAIFPYVKSEEIFLIPGTQDSYTFNANLSDTSLAALKEPARVVLFYEGENEQPMFRYDGKAAVAFADGHVKLVSPDEAKVLMWKP